MPDFRYLPFLLIQLASLTPALATPPPPKHPIVGTWDVYVTGTDCVETWEIRADGTTHNFSGAEESFSEYQVSRSPNKQGSYIFLDTITRTNGRPDCLGGRTPAGNQATDYLVPLPGDRFKICSDAALADCVGVLVRASPPACPHFRSCL